MPQNIETLKKITFETMPQFLADLNANLAVIQNSPLFKGVLGDDGNDGNDGLRGERGSRFLFVNTNKFIAVFGSEISKGSDVNLTFLNNKLVNFNTKKQLLTAFEVTELVDKDVVVLTDSTMLNYDANENQFVDTGQAFNPENNFINNIQQTIEEIVKQEIENNPTIKNATNVFDYYDTLGKNYADDNSSLVTDNLLPTTVYSPYIKGYNNNVGIKIDNHKYYGYTDERFPQENNGTMVFGSIKLYYQLLMKTIAVDGQNTLTSDYAVGVDNIPSLILLQDTYNNGMMFGYKGKTNLKSFASIFKNDQNEVVIKSDSSKKNNEFSALKLHKDYLKYEKVVNFLDDLNVGKNLSVLGDIDNKLIQTGHFSASKKLVDLDLGDVSGNTNLNSINVALSQYKDNVLVTDSSGKIVKTFTIEKMNVAEVVDLNLYDISKVPSSSTKFLTSNYFTILAKRFNSLSQYITSNYWRKNQFATGDIPDLKLKNSLIVGGATNLADLFIVNKESSLITVKSTTFDVESDTIKIIKYANKVLVADANGSLVKTYEIATQNFTPTVNQTTGAITGNGTFTKSTEILTSKYYNIIATLINAQNKFIVDNYWRKNQFASGDINDLVIGNSIKINKANLDVGGKFIITDTTTTVKNEAIFSSKVTLSLIKSRVLVTDANGVILGTYLVDSSTSSNTVTQKTNSKNNQTYEEISVTISASSNPTNSFVKYNLIKNIVDNITAVIAWVNKNFWRKDQMSSGEISDIKTSSSLSTDGNFNAGDTSNRNISTVGDNTTLGKTNGKLNLRGEVTLNNYVNGFLSTNGNGLVSVTYKMSNKLPKVSTADGVNGSSNGGDYSYVNMNADYWSDFDIWVNGSSSTKGIYEVENDANNVINGKHFSWIVGMFGGLSIRIKNMYTKTEINNKLNNLLPVGSVIDFYGKYADIPDGWSICDGRTKSWMVGGIFYQQYKTPDLINKYTKGINGENYNDTSSGFNQMIPARQCGDIDSGKVNITAIHLPNMEYSTVTESDGNHRHSHKDTFVKEVPSALSNFTPSDYQIGVDVDSRNSRGNTGLGWDRTYYIHRIIETYDSGYHNHTVKFKINPYNTQEPLIINPRSFGMYKIVKYRNI